MVSKEALSMASEWHQIRPFDGSQENAFEELCCQLAEDEHQPRGSRFTRKGRPDGGLECYWTLPSGDEVGWQCKFFLTSPENSQWAQLDKAAKNAIEKHPRLTELVVCLPLDRPDARSERKGKKTTSMFDRWNSFVTAWKEFASEKSRTLVVSYWGSHEIFSRLLRDDNAGRYYFWFKRDYFGTRWFKHQVKDQITNCGPRYNPDLNVEVPAARYVDALARTEAFRSEIMDHWGTIRRAAHNDSDVATSNADVKDFRAEVESLLALVQSLSEARLSFKPEHSLLREVFERLLQRVNLSFKEAQSDRVRHKLDELSRALWRTLNFLESDRCRLDECPLMLLAGPAGAGKTHFLCEVASKRVGLGQPTILLLGAQFSNGEPWSQIINQLQLQCKTGELLGALDAAAQTQDTRALIIVDAINEGEGRQLWSSYLNGMLELVARYKRVAIILSIRSSYESTLLPDGLDQTGITRVEHHGFAGVGARAAEAFFDYYGILHPRIPAWTSEFQNPLFLRIACETLQNLSLDQFPDGLWKFSNLFLEFLRSVDTKLVRELDIDPESRPATVSSGQLAVAMLDENRDWLTRNEARVIVDSLFPPSGWEHSVFNRLIRENVLVEDTSLQGEQASQVVRFSYERFSDFLLAETLLMTCESGHEVAARLENYDLTRPGLVEALATRTPERFGVELPQVWPRQAIDNVRTAVLSSVVWRKPQALSSKTLGYLDEWANSDAAFEVDFLDVLVTVSADPSHPFNADFLHDRLRSMTMADRDCWWSTFLQDNFASASSTSRVLSWLSTHSTDRLSNRSRQLVGKLLAWFFTSSSRPLRDTATKALVRLFQDDLLALKSLLDEFADVDEPYVVERLLATSYGCVLRFQDTSIIPSFAGYLADWFWGRRTEVFGVLARDFARGVSEYAKLTDPNFDVTPFQPPYDSTLPPFPSDSEIDQACNWDGNGAREIRASVTGLGDFSRYVLGLNFGADSNWFKEDVPQNELEEFEQSLTSRQRTFFGVWRGAWSSYFLTCLAGASDSKKEKKLARCEASLLRSMGKKKQTFFLDGIKPIITENIPAKSINQDKVFNLKLAQKYILKRVIELGWSETSFGRFDARWGRASFDRRADKPERLGKKYQWIAWHELLARLGDNYLIEDDTDEIGPYSGPWQLQMQGRDIDPSITIRKTENKSSGPSWWSRGYENWALQTPHVDWLRDISDYPELDKLIQVTEPKTGQRFLSLKSFHLWEQPPVRGYARGEYLRRELWVHCRGYLVRKEQSQATRAWARRQNFLGAWMPNAPSLTGVFLGEIGWSPAFRYHQHPFYGMEDWSIPRRCPMEVATPCIEYSWERGFDCSIDDTISIYVPSPLLAECLMLKSGRDGRCYDERGELVAFDPSVFEGGRSAFLVDHERLANGLAAHELDVFWVLYSEKRILGGDFRQFPFVGVTGAYWLDDSSKVEGIHRLVEEPG